MLGDSYLGSSDSEVLVGSLAILCESIHLFSFDVMAKSL